jgi:CubicO group peptidase (beta-lactamase class C family)
MTFQDMHGRTRNWNNSLKDTYTDGIVVLHRGRRIYERYFGALQPQLPHACFSITKSYAATLAATLIQERALDENKTVSHYLPEMAGTAYQDATLRQVLDMQIGVAYSELYSDPRAHIWDYARAGGLRPRAADYKGPKSFYEYLMTLRPEGAHGSGFAYKTVNTEVMCWVMKRIVGVGLAEMLSQRIWSRIGCEEDGCITVDSIGVPMGGGGLNAGLRDLCRFGELLRCEGAYQGEQIIPAAVVADIRRGSDPAKFAVAGYTLLPGYSYRNMWWVSHNPHGMFEARGIHGQRLYIAPRAELVIARFSSHPIATSAANDPITLPAFAALSALLMRGV